MSLFSKKKNAPANPYYSAAPQPAVQQAPQQPNAIDGRDDVPKPFPVPLLPTPEPLTIPNVDTKPFISPTGMKRLDMIRIGAEAKSFAFVKLSDFKRILDDIKTLNTRIMETKDDLENFSKLVKEQEEHIDRYLLVIRDLEKTINEITDSLSNVED